MIDYLKQVRKQNKISIEDMALRLKISPVSLSMYENGRREMGIKCFKKYAEELGFELRLLVSEK